jgi:hypothetical protein
LAFRRVSLIAKAVEIVGGLPQAVAVVGEFAEAEITGLAKQQSRAPRDVIVIHHEILLSPNPRRWIPTNSALTILGREHPSVLGPIDAVIPGPDPELVLLDETPLPLRVLPLFPVIGLETFLADMMDAKSLFLGCVELGDGFDLTTPLAPFGRRSEVFRKLGECGKVSTGHDGLLERSLCQGVLVGVTIPPVPRHFTEMYHPGQAVYNGQIMNYVALNPEMPETIA